MLREIPSYYWDSGIIRDDFSNAPKSPADVARLGSLMPVVDGSDWDGRKLRTKTYRVFKEINLAELKRNYKFQTTWYCKE